MAWLQAATALAGAATSAPTSGVPTDSNSSNQRNGISIAPVGVNLGAILQPMMDNPFNGGMGLQLPAERFSGVSLKSNDPVKFKTPGTLKASLSNQDIPTGALAIGGGIILTFILLSRM